MALTAYVGGSLGWLRRPPPPAAAAAAPGHGRRPGAKLASQGPTASAQAAAAGLVAGVATLVLAAQRPKSAAVLGKGGRARRSLASRRATASVSPVPEEAAPEPEEERRVNPWDGRVYTLRELRRFTARADWTENELMEHWNNSCQPLAHEASAAEGGPSGGAAAVALPEAPQVKAWRQMWTLGPVQSLWSAADMWHIHGLSGAAYMILGFGLLLDTALGDMAALGGEEVHQMPQELALLALAFGVVNALSGLQPRLLLGSPGDLAKSLGFGPDGSTKSGGFVNASVFFLILAYQSVRALPGFPPLLAVVDPAVGLASVLAMAHTAFILDSWVRKGSIHRVDALVLPNILNLPVAWQLMTSGGAFVEQLSAQHDGWPELFFSANFAVAWALSAVTFILSVHERRVISQELRGLLMLGLPLAVFAVVPLRAASLVPEWLQSDWVSLLLLHAPSAH